MRILHLLSQTELTGSEVYAETLAQFQDGRGHQIFVISDRTHRSFPGTVLNLPISTGSFWTRMSNIWKLKNFLIENQIDLIHCHSRAACRHAHWASRLTKTPIVTTLHGYQHVSFSKRLMNIYGDTVIAVCEAIRDQLVQKFKVPETSIKVLRNPMPVSETPPTHDGNRKWISLIGRASGPKGRRLKQVFQEETPAWLSINPEVGVRLVLPGLSAFDAQNLAKSLPADRIQIETRHVDLKPLYQDSQIVVGSGRIALEAFLQGAEVIGLGEARLQGRLTDETFTKQLQDNFGDVGTEEILDPQAVTHELRKMLRSPMTNREREQIWRKMQTEFNQTRICEEIEEIYRATCLWKKAPSLPILMYHKVPANPLQSKHRIFVTAENFEKHLLFFHSQGFQTLTFDDLSDYWFGRKPLSEFPAKPLLLTFDDGYRDNLEHALPLLQKYQMKATLFLLADHSILENNWDHEEGQSPAPLMNLNEKKELPPEIYSIGSHGLQHLDLRQLPDQQVLEQMKRSKEELKKDLGCNPKAFAYPFGWVDSRLPELAKEAGYDFAVNTDRGALRWVDNRHSLFRINIFPEESWFSLWRKTSPGYRKRYFKTRGQ